MKKRYIPALLPLIMLLCAGSSFAQMVGDCVFLKGKYVEVGIAPNGGYGSTLPAPAGYHPNLGTGGGFTFWDPGAGSASFSSNLLGFVADYGADGWTVGSPGYWGDYYLPGTPQEGWAVITGITPESQAYIPIYNTSFPTTGFTGGLAGTNVGYTNSGGISKGIWEGTDGNLKIRQTTTLDTNKLYFTVNVVMINTSTTTPIPDIYYIRTVDPDNEESVIGFTGFPTNNEITYQLPNPGNKVLVSATGTTAASAYLGLGTKDCRAKCSIFHLGGLVPASNPMAVHNETASTSYLYAAGSSSAAEDCGIGLTFNVGTLAPGDSTSLSYAYILNATYIDSALNSTLPQFILNGHPAADTTRDTINYCSADTVKIQMLNGGFYHWSYSPSTFLSDLTGPTTTVHTDSVTSDITYTVTGVSPCDTIYYFLTISHDTFSGPPTSPVTYCQGAPSGPLTVDVPPGPLDTLAWWTTPVGGAMSDTAFWPSTAIAGTQTYYVSTYRGDACRSNRTPITVTITPMPGPPYISGLTPYCFGQTFEPFVTYGPGILWYPGPTGGIGSTTAPTVFTGAAGYTTVYASQTIGGCEGARASFVTRVMPKIIPGFSFAKHFGCHGDTVTFANSSIFSSKYTWAFGDGSSDTAKNPAHIYSVQGSYSVTVYAIDSANCVDSAKQSFDLIHPIKSVFTATPTIICQNQPVTFTNSSIGIDSSFVWYFGNGVTDSNTNTSYTFTNTGVYTVSLVVKDFAPCYDTSKTVIYVDSNSSIRMDLSDTVLCAGTYITLTGKYSDIGKTGINWAFDEAAGDSINGINPIKHSFSPGLHTIKATVHYRACPDSSYSRSIMVYPQPSIDLGRDTSICKGSEAIVLKDQNNNKMGSYVWSTGEHTKTISIVEPGLYFATVNVNNCYASDSIKVSNDCYMNIPNAFTPNGDGVNDYFYPRDLLTKGLTVFKMNIYNRWGQLLFETSTTDGAGWDGKLNGIPQPEGVYVYIIDATFRDGQSEHHQGNVSLLR